MPAIVLWWFRAGESSLSHAAAHCCAHAPFTERPAPKRTAHRVKLHFRTVVVAVEEVGQHVGLVDRLG